MIANFRSLVVREQISVIHPGIKESMERKPKARKRKEEDEEEEEKNLANHLFFFRFSYRNRWTPIVLDRQF